MAFYLINNSPIQGNMIRIYIVQALPTTNIHFGLVWLMTMKMLRNLSEKHGAKFPFTMSTALGYSVARIVLDGAFSEIRKLKASPVDGQPLQQNNKKRRQRKGEKKFKKP